MKDIKILRFKNTGHYGLYWIKVTIHRGYHVKWEKIKQELAMGKVETRQLGRIAACVDTAMELSCYTAQCCEMPISASYYLSLHLAIICNYD